MKSLKNYFIFIYYKNTNLLLYTKKLQFLKIYFISFINFCIFFEKYKFIKEIKTKIKLLDKTKNYDTGISSVAFQEYVEAIVFFEYIKNSVD